MKMFRVTYKSYLPTGKFLGLRIAMVEAYDKQEALEVLGYVDSIIVYVEEI
jgi:hypothetical protein